MRPLRLLFLVDVEGWAWDIASKELLASSNKIVGDVLTCAEFCKNTPHLDKYDFIIFYPFPHKPTNDILKEQACEKTIIGIAGGDQIDSNGIKSFKERCDHFPFIGANNPTIQSIYARHFPEKIVLLLSHGHDTELFNIDPIPHKKFTVGWVGRTARESKRYKMAKTIVGGIKDVAFKIADYYGDGTKKYIQHNKMPKFYNSIDVLLVTSEFEAHPLIVYEAMSCGVPVVSTRVGDLNDLILNGISGFLLDIDDEDSAFRAILELLKLDPEFRNKMGKAARQTILQRWSWDKINIQYENLIDLIKCPKCSGEVENRFYNLCKLCGWRDIDE